jgi:hypothetical protein
MEQSDVFSRRIRWLAIGVGLSTSALFFFWSPLAVFAPGLLPLGAALQPRLSDLGKRIVKWFIWVWALGWSPGLVVLSFLVLPDILRRTTHASVVLGVASLIVVSALLILWWDVELIMDGVRRIRIWRSAPIKEPRPVALGLWVLAVALNLWVGWGLVNTTASYRGAGDLYAGNLYALVLSTVEAALVLAFDVYLIWRLLKLRPARRTNVHG